MPHSFRKDRWYRGCGLANEGMGPGLRKAMEG